MLAVLANQISDRWICCVELVDSDPGRNQLLESDCWCVEVEWGVVVLVEHCVAWWQAQLDVGTCGVIAHGHRMVEPFASEVQLRGCRRRHHEVKYDLSGERQRVMQTDSGIRLEPLRYRWVGW